MKVKEKNSQIPIKIGTAEFYFYRSKLKQPKFEKELTRHKEELMKWLGEFEKGSQDEDKQIKLLNKKLGEAFDSILGPGSYERIYEQSPSVLDNLDIFIAVNKNLTAKIKEYKRR